MTEITATGWEKLVDAGRRRLQQGDSAGAESSFSAAVAEAESLGATSPGLAACLTALAQVRTQQRDHRGAEALFRRALEAREQAAEFDHAGIIQILGYLATLHSARADYEEAETLLLRALSLADRFLPAGHAAIGSLLNNLARLYFKRGDHEKTDRMLVRLLQIKQALGTEHPEVAGVLASIAALRSALGKHDVAEQLWRRVLAIREKSLPSNDPAIITTLNSLADACAAQGEQEEALHFRERGLRLQAQSVATPQVDHPAQPPLSTPAGLPAVQPPAVVAPPPLREPTPVAVRAQAPVVPTPAYSNVQQAKITPIPLLSIEPPMPAAPMAAQGIPTPVAPRAAIPPGQGLFGAGSPPQNGRFSPGTSGGFSPGTSGGFPPGTSGGFPPGTSGGFSPGTSGGFSPGTSGGFSPGTSGGFSPHPSGGFSPVTSGSFTAFSPNPPTVPPVAFPGRGGIGPVGLAGSAPAPALPPVAHPTPPTAAPARPAPRPDPEPGPSGRESEPSLERPRYQGYSIPSKRRSHMGKVVAAAGVVGLLAAANVFMDRRAADASASSIADSVVAEPTMIRIPAESLRVAPARRPEPAGPKALTLDSALAVMARHAGGDGAVAARQGAADSAIAARPADSVGGRAVIRIPSIDAVSRAVEAGTRARVDSAMTPITPRTPGFASP